MRQGPRSGLGRALLVAADQGREKKWNKLTAAEITAANAENARLAAIRSAESAVTEQSVVEFEMAESGHIIEFPADESQMDPLSIAHENPVANDIRRSN